MNLRVPPRVAAINSFAGYGRCSTTEALPILSAMGVQACPVPTELFSNHTGFPGFFCRDLTELLPEYLAQWDRLGLVFDGICCGFLGKSGQIPIIASFLESQRKKGCPMILVDPVMGDQGRTYRTVPPSRPDQLKKLVRLADIITPNITEACLLTGLSWKEKGWSQEELLQLCQKLHALGPSRIAITGLSWQHGRTEGFSNFISLQNSDGSLVTSSVKTASAGPSRHGTGDIFAAILTADAVLGQDFTGSVQKAASFIGDCIRASEALHIPEQEGVCFESLLGQLVPGCQPSGKATDGQPSGGESSSAMR
ncbi:MAG: pyridoxamine kinase [Eubacteriales bacterium]|nr:pyridoxamine kinase [Eubacteriales bacterium]